MSSWMMTQVIFYERVLTIMRKNQSRSKFGVFLQKRQITNARQVFFYFYILSWSGRPAAWTPHPPQLNFPLKSCKCHLLMELVTRSNNQLTGDKPRRIHKSAASIHIHTINMWTEGDLKRRGLSGKLFIWLTRRSGVLPSSLLWASAR